MKDEVEEKAESIYEKIQVDGVIRSEAYVVRIVAAALKADRDAAFVRGLERALELMRHATFYGEGITAILAEIEVKR